MRTIEEAERIDRAELASLTEITDIADFLVVRWGDCSQLGDTAQCVLDGLVHDVKSDEASQINNSGVREQLAYLINSHGAEETFAEFLAETLYPDT